MALACETAGAVAAALKGALIPALRTWAADADILPASLLPKVVSELGRRTRAAAAAATASQHHQQLAQAAATPSPGAGPPGGSGHTFHTAHTPGVHTAGALPGASPAAVQARPIAFTGQSLSYSYAAPQPTTPSYASAPPHVHTSVGTYVPHPVERRFPNAEYQVRALMWA